LFPTRDFAITWLRLAGCVKYVDGGWVANVLGVSSTSTGKTGDAAMERDAGKLAFQVISEEFGDGDLAKNHVYVYHRLLSQLSSSGVAPTGDQPSFDSLSPTSGSPRCWTAAIAQQCIGLLASTSDYFPEAIGFNMAYETLPYHLLVTSHELRELKLDDYYFALHITIDNPDSGHAAVARVAVEKYLQGVEARDGEEGLKKAWKRVQAGVVLADGLPTTPCAPREFHKINNSYRPRLPSNAPSTPPANPTETRFVNLLLRKASAAEKMHCPSRMLISGHTLEYWLDPSTISFDKALTFVRGLEGKKPWVVRGDPGKSKLVQMVLWGGRMFGAFSRGEVDVLVKWVEGLGLSSEEDKVEGSYERFIGYSEEDFREFTTRREKTIGSIKTTFTTTQ
jgi:hypothetical protein